MLRDGHEYVVYVRSVDLESIRLRTSHQTGIEPTPHGIRSTRHESRFGEEDRTLTNDSGDLIALIAQHTAASTAVPRKNRQKASRGRPVDDSATTDYEDEGPSRK